MTGIYLTNNDPHNITAIKILENDDPETKSRFSTKIIFVASGREYSIPSNASLDYPHDLLKPILVEEVRQRLADNVDVTA